MAHMIPPHPPNIQCSQFTMVYHNGEHLTLGGVGVFNMTSEGIRCQKSPKIF